MVADGGSTDESLDVLHRYQDRHRNLHVYPVTTIGETAHINDGLERAQGDLVAWLCADDVYAPGCFRAVAKTFRETAAQWVHGRVKIIDGEGRETREAVTRLKEALQPRYSYTALQCASFIAEPSVFMHRGFQRTVGWYDESFPLTADYDYWLRAGVLSSPVFIDKHLASWRAHGGSTSVNRYREQMREMYRVQRKHSGPWLLPIQWAAMHGIIGMYQIMNRGGRWVTT